MYFSYVATQRNTDSLQKWAERSLMKFNKRKCPVLFLREQPRATVQVWTEWLKSSLAGEDLGVLVDTKLNMSKQFICGVKGIYSTLACDRKIVANRSRKVSFPFYTALVRHIWSLGPVQGRHGCTGETWKRVRKMIKELKMCCMRKGWVSWNLMWEVVKKDETRQNQWQDKRNNKHKINYESLNLSIRKKSKLCGCFNCLPSFKLFKTQVDMALSNLLLVTLLTAEGFD